MPDTLKLERKPVFCGGDLGGVVEKLDYLTDLGITAIWLSPFTRTNDYHGYSVTDHFAVEERFGGMRALRALIAAAHERGMRLIMDFVPNHVHYSHPWFAEAQANPKNAYREWFYWRPKADYLSFLHYSELPKLNLDHAAARDQVIQAACYWLDQGIDGFRLDHVMGPSLNFWAEFRRQIKQHRPDAVLIGEVWYFGIPVRCLPTLQLPRKHRCSLMDRLGFDVLDRAMLEYAELFDGLLDFTFQKILREGVARSTPGRADAALQKQLESHYARFPWECRLLPFLDNHDMNRFLFEAGGDRARLQRGLEILFAQPGPPILYYGTEIGLEQDGPVRGDYGDLQVRRLMNWDQPDLGLHETCRKLIRQRGSQG